MGREKGWGGGEFVRGRLSEDETDSVRMNAQPRLHSTLRIGRPNGTRMIDGERHEAELRSVNKVEIFLQGVERDTG